MRIFNLLISITLFSILFSCSNSNENKEQKSAIIAGKITNFENDKIYLTNIFLSDTITDSISIDTAGNFHKSIELINAKYFTFKNGKQFTNIYLNPGDSLYITLDFQNFDESIKYTGIGNENNNYLASYINLKSKMPSMYDLIFVELNDFIFKTDSINNEYLKNLDKYLLKDVTFKNNETNRIKGTISFMKSIYPMYYSYYNKTEMTNLPDNYYEFGKSLDINDTSLYLFKDFEEYFTNIISELAEKKAKHLDTTLSSDYINLKSKIFIIDSLVTNKSINEYYTYSTIYDQLNYVGSKNVDEFLTTFKNKNPKSIYINKLNYLYSKWEKISEGKNAPDFLVFDENGKEYSLNNFKGKHLYIDVWATWCGPCKTEIPHFEKLKEKYKGKNIEFVSISVDENKESWEKMINDKKMTGIQLFASGWNSSITKDYNINSIPRFILIDPKGVIINANADRPSGNISDIISKLPNL